MTRLWIETHGTGRDVVLVHGWGMHSAIWRDFALQAAQFCRVTLVDLPGHGNSAALENYSLQNVASILAVEVGEVLGEDAGAVWLGWSLGGAVVLELAQLFPQLVQGLILLCANPCYSVRDDWSCAMQSDLLDEFSRAVENNDQLTLARFSGLMVQGEGVVKRDILRLLRKLLPQAPAADRAALLWGLQVLAEADLRSRYAALKIPLLAVLGAQDPLVPATLQQPLQQLNQSATVEIIPNCGHVPFYTATDDLLIRLANFIKYSS